MNNVTIRELQEEDLWNGFLTSLDSLRQASNLKKERALEIFDKINHKSDQIITVAELNGKVVGSATLLLETKFIHNGGLVGHIEDVVVEKSHQGQKIGEKIIKYLLDYSQKRGCYKTILDCKEDVREFYEKLGFKHDAYALRFDHI